MNLAPSIANRPNHDNGPPLPLLENGDRLTQEEFHRRYEAYPDHVKIELIGGTVFKQAPRISGIDPSNVLENGDCLTQEEFHRRYATYPEHIKFELIGGTVFMSSPMKRSHGRYDVKLGTVFDIYESRTPGVETGHNITTILADDFEPQPDSYLRVLEECGGQSHVNEKEYVVGSPELLAEISHSTVSIDLNAKREGYQATGTREYIVVCIEEKKVVWFDFTSDSELEADEGGILRSRVFPGLWVHVPALLELNTIHLLDTLKQGLDSPEHAKFVKSLERKRKKRRTTS